MFINLQNVANFLVSFGHQEGERKLYLKQKCLSSPLLLLVSLVSISFPWTWTCFSSPPCPCPCSCSCTWGWADACSRTWCLDSPC